MRLNEIAVIYHEKLNPKLWSESQTLKPEVKDALVKIAKEFIDFLKVDTSYITDVIITGSNCNYNWKQTSDLDIHVIMNFEEFQKSCSVVDIEKLFKTKKSLWNEEHDIDIYGIPTELYVQDGFDGLTPDAAIYSIKSDKWLRHPHKEENLEVDEEAVKEIYDAIKKSIDKIINSKVKDDKAIEAYKDKVLALRKQGLDRDGEFSTENIAFKRLRDNGYMEKLNDYHDKVRDDNLSL